MNVTRRRERIMAINKGRSGFKTLAILVPAIPHPMNRTLPTGGVHKPMLRFNTMIIPKWMGLTPNCTTTGKNMGVKMRTAGVISMNVPTRRRKRLIISKMITRLSEIAIRAALIY
ncbi:unnamed protein product [marine sediment metagenome]|uniref:Uncharacterized protein n=1 Tax=marine sediment metagenome TaxID=412755 RepID=X1KKL9_9ZZZZ